MNSYLSDFTEECQLLGEGITINDRLELTVKWRCCFCLIFCQILYEFV